MADMTVRKICGPCNSGGMAELEQESRPVIGKLVSGSDAISLDRDGMRLATTWGTKTLLVSQLMAEREPPIVETTQYLQFFRDRAPLPDSKVWAGSYRVTDHSPWSISMVRIGPVGSGAWRGTLNVGAFVVHILHLPGRKWVLRATTPPRAIRR